MGLKKLLQAQIAVVTRPWGVEMTEIPLHNYGTRSPLASLKKREIFMHDAHITNPNMAGQGNLGEQLLVNCVSYKCSVALQLASKRGISPVEIAEKLVLGLKTLQSLDPHPQVSSQGIINLSISDRYLANWLEELRLNPSPSSKVDQNNPIEINYLPIQSAHARCCSLLKLAARENVIQLKNKLENQLPDQWQICLPAEIPWLDQQEKFRLINPQEQHLINLLVNLVDEFDSCHDSAIVSRSSNDSFNNQNPSPKWLKVATEISHAFANFYRYSRIFGEVSSGDLPLAQARLGLVAITRWGLQKLLAEYLGAIAPSEL